MPENCASCGQPIGFRRFLGAKLCGACSARERAAREAALAQYKQLAAAVADPRTNPATIGENLPALAERAGLDVKKRHDINWQALVEAFRKALADEIITSDEEERLGQAANALGLGTDGLNAALGQFQEEVFIARVNDGRLPTLASPTILLKRGEVAHLETPAELLKEVLIREYKGGSSGVSFRIMKGVSYRVGSHRGTMEVVGSRLDTADTGTLTVTSRRAVFTGPRRTVEVRYDKLLSVGVYKDAIQFSVSNRKNPSIFKVSSGPMIAAAVNAAAQDELQA